MLYPRFLEAEAWAAAPAQLTSPKSPARSGCCWAGLEFGLLLRANQRWSRGRSRGPSRVPPAAAPPFPASPCAPRPAAPAFSAGGLASVCPPFCSHFKARFQCSPSGFLPLVNEVSMGSCGCSQEGEPDPKKPLFLTPCRGAALPDTSVLTSEILWRDWRERKLQPKGRGDVVEWPLGVVLWGKFKEGLRGTGSLRTETGWGAGRNKPDTRARDQACKRPADC